MWLTNSVGSTIEVGLIWYNDSHISQSDVEMSSVTPFNTVFAFLLAATVSIHTLTMQKMHKFLLFLISHSQNKFPLQFLLLVSETTFIYCSRV